MLTKTILCGALVLCAGIPLEANAASSGQMSSQITNDAEITAALKALYAQSALLKSLNISVTTNQQHVMLSGIVDTSSQYERAVSLAESIAGVQDVDADHLKVKSSNAPLADTFITAKVKGVFLKEKLFDSDAIEYWPVKVETKNGVVYLTGNVSNDEQRQRLVELAETVKGVKQVNSAITLS